MNNTLTSSISTVSFKTKFYAATKKYKEYLGIEISFPPQWVNPDFIYRQFDAISFSRIGKAFNAVKIKGYTFESVFTILVTVC